MDTRQLLFRVALFFRINKNGLPDDEKSREDKEKKKKRVYPSDDHLGEQRLNQHLLVTHVAVPEVFRRQVGNSIQKY
ncbi:MAG: hypothetical protein PWQ31_1506 [Eubacteriales bacterium]|nr:hypothetical protein [Eubacteriales bacterium]